MNRRKVHEPQILIAMPIEMLCKTYDASGATNRCGACQMVYYCSKACQCHTAEGNDPDLDCVDYQGKEGINAILLAKSLDKKKHIAHVGLEDCGLNVPFAQVLRVNQTL